MEDEHTNDAAEGQAPVRTRADATHHITHRLVRLIQGNHSDAMDIGTRDPAVPDANNGDNQGYTHMHTGYRRRALTRAACAQIAPTEHWRRGAVGRGGHTTRRGSRTPTQRRN